MSWYDTVTRLVGRSRDSVAPQAYMPDEERSDKAKITDASWVSAPIHGMPRKINYTELQDYELDITVQAAKNFIVDSVATTEWDVMPREGMEDEENEPDPAEALAFFDSSEWDVSFGNLLRGVVADILLYDAGTIVLAFPEYCYDADKMLVKDDVAPRKMRARDGRSFMIQVTPYGDVVKYWQYSFVNQSTVPAEFAPQEIIYIQENPSTRSPYGVSKLEVVKNVADLMMATQVGHRAAQENALQIGGVINHPDILDQEEIQRRSRVYNTKLKGEQNKGAWLVTGGQTVMTPINATADDDSWIPGSEFYQQQILAIFKVPKTVLGITSSDTNRATAMAQSSNFKRMGVSTMLTLIEETLTRSIVRKYFHEDLVFRFKREVDLTDEKLRADIDAENVQTGIRTVNEIRAREGLEEIEEPEEEDYDYDYDYADYEEEVPEEGFDEGTDGTEKSIDTMALEDSAVEDLDEINNAAEAKVLKELEAVYGDVNVEKGSKNRIWIPKSPNHIGHWREVEGGKGDDDKDSKRKINVFQTLGDSLKKELQSMVDKFTGAKMSTDDRAKVDSIKTKMDKAYSNRDEAIKAWEKHTGRKFVGEKAKQSTKDKSKVKDGKKTERKPLTNEQKAKAAESKRLRGEIDKYQSEGDAAKTSMSDAIDKYTATSETMTAAGKKEVDSFKSQMEAAYKQVEAKKKELKAVEANSGSDTGDKISEKLAEVNALKEDHDKHDVILEVISKELDAVFDSMDDPEADMTPEQQKIYDEINVRFNAAFEVYDAAKWNLLDEVKLYDEMSGKSYYADRNAVIEQENEIKRQEEAVVRKAARDERIKVNGYEITGNSKDDAKIEAVENEYNDLISKGHSMEDAVKMVIHGKEGVSAKSFEMAQNNSEPSAEAKDSFDGAVKDFNGIISDKYKDEMVLRFKHSPGRPHNMFGIVMMEMNKEDPFRPINNTIFHESGHTMEMYGENKRVANAFVDNRTKDAETVSLNTLHPGVGYDDAEITRPDDFIDSYIGRSYEHGETEVISVGVEQFAKQRNMQKLYEDDPDHFMLTVAIMKGEFL